MNTLPQEQMSNYNCEDLYCAERCCTRNGYCPNSSSSDIADNSCYYYYGANTQSTTTESTFNGAIAIPIIVVGGIVIIAFFAIMYWCWRRRHQPTGMPHLTIGGQPMDPGYGYGPQYGPQYGPPYGGPVYPGGPVSGDHLVYN